jgi:hypothetical protein
MSAPSDNLDTTIATGEASRQTCIALLVMDMAAIRIPSTLVRYRSFLNTDGKARLSSAKRARSDLH